MTDVVYKHRAVEQICIILKLRLFKCQAQAEISSALRKVTISNQNEAQSALSESTHKAVN